MTDGSVAIAWVHSTENAYSWTQSLLDLQGRLMVSGRSGRMFGMRFSSGGGLPLARNKAVAHFLEGDEEWLFWIDTDMGFKPEALEQLLEVADPDVRPVVGGLCFTNVETAEDGLHGFATFPIPTVYRWAKNPDGSVGFVSWHDYPRDELYECDATGSAFILIHRSVFEKMLDKNGPNWYAQIPNPAAGGMFGEDMSFCIQCHEIDVPVFVHTGVKTSHLKPVWLSEVHFDMWRDAASAAGVDSQVAAGGAKPMNRAERRRAERKVDV
jgi:hypothetical protein